MLNVPTYDAVAMLREATARHNIHLSGLVAETALWAHPNVHRYLLRENGTGAFSPHIRRYRAGQGEKPTQQIGHLYLDNNSYANNAIKRALGISREHLVGFEACHIWRRSCYDERYHTAIANLVLLPRSPDFPIMTLRSRRFCNIGPTNFMTGGIQKSESLRSSRSSTPLPGASPSPSPAAYRAPWRGENRANDLRRRRT